MLVVYLSICWFLGLWLASVTAFNPVVWLATGGVGLVGAGLFFRRPKARLFLACLGVVGLAAVRYRGAVPQIDKSHVAFYNDSEDIILTGLVVDEPDVRDRFVNLRLAVEHITLAEGGNVPVEGKVLVRAFRFPVIAYGTRLEVTGRLETPPEDEEFSYKEYLARQGIHSLMALPRVAVLSEGGGNPVYRRIFAFKNRAQATISRLIPDPQAALLSGILLGNDNGMPPDLAEAFRVTGLTHIIAISG